jgi:murein DD-endopeptidase MepM/ murein hydrolase activator NlpD
MQDYTVMIFRDHSSPVRRYRLARRLLQRGLVTAVVVTLVVVAVVVDWVRVRGDVGELEALRSETAEQREQIAMFSEKVQELDARFVRLSEFERKVRVIANLPKAVADNGSDALDGVGGGEEDEGGAVVRDELPRHKPLEGAAPGFEQMAPQASAWFVELDASATRLLSAAAVQERSLEDLVSQLRGKSDRLASTPSVWPAKGWMTSGFGRRVSPFTGKPQMHAGLDIAAERGTAIVAPARGRVSFTGRKGPLGNTLEIDHGFGMKTLYGHCDAIHVKKGQTVERGQWIAEIGSSGRSTGPHLHYAVLRQGRPVDPKQYILD